MLKVGSKVRVIASDAHLQDLCIMRGREVFGQKIYEIKRIRSGPPRMFEIDGWVVDEESVEEVDE